MAAVEPGHSWIPFTEVEFILYKSVLIQKWLALYSFL